MQREERCLCQQTRCHKCGRYPGNRFGLNPCGQKGNVERAVGTIDQRGSEQIEYRASQREKHVAQGRFDRLLIAFETDKRHRGKGQQFERDVEIKKIGADGYCI